MRHDTISDVLSAIKNGDGIGKNEILVPFSKLSKEILLLMQKKGYIGNFEEIENNRGNLFKVYLLGKINNCGSIRPRFSVKSDEYEKWERRFLPASDVGFLIITSSHGIMIHEEAKKKGLGGTLLAFVY